MKLRNKKTGEIGDYKDFEYDLLSTYNSLAELNENWEDYEEEPKLYWYILSRGEIHCIEDIDNSFDKEHKEIGNYFESKEEAEKAVEKLKAWKRLKDKGFKFTDWNASLGELYFKVPGSFFPDDDFITVETRHDLDLLFRGKE